MVRDGEGATKLVDIVVAGTADDEQAEKIAAAIAGSVLVKTAFSGADPNWGRLLAAAGNAGVKIDQAKLAIDVDDVALVKDGVLVSDAAKRMARTVMRRDSFTVTVSFGKGKGRAVRITSDLTEAYVRFNSQYTS
jgi:glutamate N-acetyltransferase/amino-acid N-acetyltransferase